MRSQTRLLGLLVASLGLFSALGAGCLDRAATTAQSILDLTIPLESAAPTLPTPAKSSQSLQWSWDVETSMPSTRYLAWVAEQLHDYQVVNRSLSGLQLGNLVGGDAYRLSITVQGGESATHVHVVLIASPD